MFALLDLIFGIYEDDNMPNDLKLSNLDRLDGVNTRKEMTCTR